MSEAFPTPDQISEIVSKQISPVSTIVQALPETFSATIPRIVAGVVNGVPSGDAITDIITGDPKITNIDTKINLIDPKITTIDTKIDSIDPKITNINTKVNAMKIAVDTLPAVPGADPYLQALVDHNNTAVTAHFANLNKPTPEAVTATVNAMNSAVTYANNVKPNGPTSLAATAALATTAVVTNKVIFDKLFKKKVNLQS